MEKKIIIAIVISIFATSFLLTIQCYSQEDAEIVVIKDILHEQINEIEKWENRANLLIFLTILVGVLGVATGVLQKFDKNWCKLATIFAGAIISLITVVNNTVFEVDHRTLRGKAHQSRKIVQEIRILLAQEINKNSEEDRQAWLSEIREKLNQISDIGAELYGSVDTEKSFNLIPAAYAQTPKQMKEQPEWIAKPPVDRVNFYFVGIGDDPSLPKARENSHRNAIKQAVEFLTAEFKTNQSAEPVSIDINRLSEYLVKSAKVEKKDFDYDPVDSLYHFYTLISLNKRFVETDIKLFAVKERMAVPQELSRALEQTESPAQMEPAQVIQSYKDNLTVARETLSAEWYKKYLEGQRLRRIGNYERAIEILQEVTRANPDFYLGWYDLAQAYDDGFNDFAKAIQAYQKAAELEPKQPIRQASFYNTFGYFLFKHKKYEEAILYFKKALEINPNHRLAARNLKATEAILKK